MKTYLWHYTRYEGFSNIIASKKLWMRDTMKMNDKEDRIYGKSSVNRAIETCNEGSILYKYKHVEILPHAPLFNHYSMSFCLNDNAHLWELYAHNHQGMALVFDVDKLQMAVYDKCGLSATEVLNFRHINYELNICDIETLCKTFEDNFMKDCHDIHYQSRLFLIKKLLYQVCTGYTKELKWKDEDEYRVCYVDQCSATHKDNISEILRLQSINRNMDALSKLGLAPEQCQNDKYILDLGSLFTSSVLPFVYIGTACAASQAVILRQLKNCNLSSTQVLSEGEAIPEMQ